MRAINLLVCNFLIDFYLNFYVLELPLLILAGLGQHLLQMID